MNFAGKDFNSTGGTTLSSKRKETVRLIANLKFSRNSSLD
jgi:hypothetical protein